MPPISAERFYNEIEASTQTLAGLVDGADLTRPVPTCPDWTLRNLATHVGRAHRWAAEIAKTRSAEFIPFRQVPDGKFPDDPAEQAPWLRAGAARVIEAVREAGSDRVWAFATMQPASFWGRRMAHETAMHRADVELALGREFSLDADLAADAISEWLDLLGLPQAIEYRPELAELRGEGQILHLHSTDPGLGQAGEWIVRRMPSGPVWEHGHTKGAVAVRGPVTALLLVLMRRVPVDEAAIEVLGDASVFDHWLEHTRF